MEIREVHNLEPILHELLNKIERLETRMEVLEERSAIRPLTYGPLPGQRSMSFGCTLEDHVTKSMTGEP